VGELRLTAIVLAHDAETLQKLVAAAFDAGVTSVLTAVDPAAAAWMCRKHSHNAGLFLGESTAAQRGISTAHAMIAARPGIRVLLVTDGDTPGGSCDPPTVRMPAERDALAEAVRAVLRAAPPQMFVTA
jgi:hypothetical protein